jgi:hypothetical protein
MTAAEHAAIAAFRAGTLPTDAFHHADHVRMAWVYVRAFGLEGALGRFVGDLKRFAAAKGVPRLYHATITQAYLTILAERMAATPTGEWPVFAEAHPDLLRWKPGVLDAYYSPERLWSDAARERFLMPDRAPAGPAPI